MGTLLKTVSKLFISVSNDKPPKQRSKCTLSADERSSSQLDTNSALSQSSDNDTRSNVKRRSSEPDVESLKRTCDEGYDSGVEPDRQPGDNSRPEFSNTSTSSFSTNVGTMKSSNDKVIVEDRSRHDRRGRIVHSSATRQVDFEQDVVVHTAFIDEDGNRQSFCERGRLKTASMRERERELSSYARLSSSQSDCNDRQPRVVKPEPPTCRTASVDLLPDPDVRFRIAREPRTGARLLRFCIRLGPAFSGGATVMVKTNSAGNKIYLLARRAAVASSSSKKSKSKSSVQDVYRDTFPLPVVVDSNLLSAIVDTDGRVLVEAPVIAPADPLLERWLDRHPPAEGSSTTKDHRIMRRGVTSE